MDLRLDGFSSRPDVLDDAQAIRAFLSGLVDVIGMTIINGPTVISFKELSGDQAAGLTADVAIAESHVYIHTWPEEAWFRLDIDSCKAFDYRAARRFIAVQLHVDTWSHTELDIERGGPPPKPIKEVLGERSE